LSKYDCNVAKYIIKSYSFDLKFIKSLTINYKPSRIYTYLNQIHIYNASEARVHVYSEDFYEIQNPSANTIYRMFDGVDSQIEVNFEKVFSFSTIIRKYGNSDTELTIYDYKSLDQIDKITFNSRLNINSSFNLFYPASENTFFLITRDGKFRLFDYQQECLMEFEVENKTNITNFSITKNGSILIIDKYGVLTVFHKR
jgi:hypothetical protein